jgi:hypothetical protein
MCQISVTMSIGFYQYGLLIFSELTPGPLLALLELSADSALNLAPKKLFCVTIQRNVRASARIVRSRQYLNYFIINIVRNTPLLFLSYSNTKPKTMEYSMEQNKLASIKGRNYEGLFKSRLIFHHPRSSVARFASGRGGG